MRTSDRDELHNVAGVIEDHQLLAQHEHPIGYAQGVRRRHRQLLEAGRGVIGQIAHGATLKSG